MCDLAGVQSLLNPCSLLHTRLYPVLDPKVVSRLEYKYSVTQSPPGHYSYVEWWDVWPVSRSGRCENESGNSQMAHKGDTPMITYFPVFQVLRISTLPLFDDLNAFRQRGLKNIGRAWIRSLTEQLKHLMLYITSIHTRVNEWGTNTHNDKINV